MIADHLAAIAAGLRVAVTGGSGRVGTALRAEMAAYVSHITVVDLNPPDSLAGNESFVRADLTSLQAAMAAFAGHDAIVHLAGHPGERAIEDIVAVNVLGTSHVYEAAHRCGIGRIVFGSSNHVTGFYPRNAVVGPDDPMRPDSRYGLSKCWGELVAGLYYDKAGIQSLIIRIGNASDRPRTLRARDIWVSAADLAQLTLIGLTHPDIDATIAFGASAGGRWWDNSAATALGYLPRDRIEDFVGPEGLSPGSDEAEPSSRHFQGGRFCAIDHDGVLRLRSENVHDGAGPWA